MTKTFFVSKIMLRFGKTEEAKKEFYHAKKKNNNKSLGC